MGHHGRRVVRVRFRLPERQRVEDLRSLSIGGGSPRSSADANLSVAIWRCKFAVSDWKVQIYRCRVVAERFAWRRVGWRHARSESRPKSIVRMNGHDETHGEFRFFSSGHDRGVCRVSE